MLLFLLLSVSFVYADNYYSPVDEFIIIEKYKPITIYNMPYEKSSLWELDVTNNNNVNQLLRLNMQDSNNTYSSNLSIGRNIHSARYSELKGDEVTFSLSNKTDLLPVYLHNIYIDHQQAWNARDGLKPTMMTVKVNYMDVNGNEVKPSELIRNNSSNVILNAPLIEGYLLKNQSNLTIIKKNQYGQIEEHTFIYEEYVEPEINAPSRPEGLIKVNSTDSSLDLIWGIVEGADGYRLYRNGQVIADIVGTSYTDNDLKKGIEYIYQVSAYNLDGESQRSISLNHYIDLDVFNLDEPLEGFEFISNWFTNFINKIKSSTISMLMFILSLLALVVGAFWLIGLSKKGIRKSR